jgi:hypothetical protein
MESKLAKEAKLALLAAARRLTPEQRLNAFVAHCQLMMELYAAGQQLRSPRKRKRESEEAPGQSAVACEALHIIGS